MLSHVKLPVRTKACEPLKTAIASHLVSLLHTAVGAITLFQWLTITKPQQSEKCPSEPKAVCPTDQYQKQMLIAPMV